MRTTNTLALAAILLCLPLRPATAGDDDVITVTLTAPAPGEPLLGEVELAAEVRARQPIREVAFYVDGVLVGAVKAPPYRLRVAVGDENRDRHVRAEARAADGASAAAERMAPAIEINEEVDLDLQQIFLTVSRRGGRRVLDLKQDQLKLLVDGRRQEIVTFAAGEIPLTAILLIDGSASMDDKRLAAALRGAQAFVAGMKPLDQAQVMVFSDRLLARTPLTDHQADLSPAFATTPEGGSAVLDHLFLALDQLEARQGRRVVVLLSDGMDVDSVLRPAELEPVVRRSRSIIYWVRLSERASPRFLDRYPPNSWYDRRSAERGFAHLERLVRLSGGRIEALRGLGGIEPAFREILAELHEQYALGFYPHPQRNDGRWRTIRVKVGRSGLKVRTREGFVNR
ncbi:MAG: VWA domain-containing protein [bacterium]|nr:VWA domain-containing protein [bacterium]